MNLRWPVLLGLIAMLALPAVAQGNYSAPESRSGATGQGYGPNYVMDGTHFLIQLDDKLDSKKLKPGKEFKAELAEDLVAPNGQTIPRGTRVRGHVSEIERGLHGRLLMSFDQIDTDHGWMPLIATVTGIPGEKGMNTVGNEGEIQKSSVGKTRILEGAGIGAATGAAAGAVAGGPQGALIGAGAGAALGGAAGLLTDRDFVLNKGTAIELTLDRPLMLPNR
jgi:type IV secretory pathway VirB10-like protein